MNLTAEKREYETSSHIRDSHSTVSTICDVASRVSFHFEQVKRRRKAPLRLFIISLLRMTIHQNQGDRTSELSTTTPCYLLGFFLLCSRARLALSLGFLYR